MVMKAKLAAGLAGVGVAVAVLLPAPAHASTCINICGGGGPPGLTNALTVLVNNPSSVRTGSDPDEGGEIAVFDAMLAANHNETVLTLV